MRWSRTVLAASVVLGMASSASAQPNGLLICMPSERYVCAMGAGCQSVSGASYLIVDVANQTVSRCGGPSPCDTYSAVFTVSGPTTNVEIPGRANFVKLLPGGAFAEVASLFTATIVSYGNCHQLDPADAVQAH